MPRPPLLLLALRAFAETGRLGSMKAAAGALGVTPGAISQQVKALERRLGLPLFERHNRELRLTGTGRQLLDPLVDAFARIEAAVDATERATGGHRHRPLLVSTSASFAAGWLVPRLGRFAALYPGIEVRIDATSALVEVGRGPGSADVALRHGLGDYPGLEVVRFLMPRLVPVGSPSRLATGPRLSRAEDVLHYPLLQNSDGADWALWLRAQGGNDAEGRALRGTRFPDDHLLVRAAVAGQGLALVAEFHAAEEIAAGRLAVALDLPWPSRFAYYVLTRPGPGRPPAALAFRDWVLREAAGCGDGLPPQPPPSATATRKVTNAAA
ncbi:LysR family transcriptional regulator [Rhodovastum atsumiense]|uniref:LysR family transcriptional regulator n=1 Tax=Rhodovastum atsumiense TaxID=504468 RepID=A0A5M6INC8_9PROT|nr:LysR substrate-binding domain-containing protein [Rhodovastum atsumiense]KAA5609773.1 LysR family transcriptional regulator [Rhodovastum atsumiense]CAH2599447.1 LysR family transcriptional regulator [Rhodovastum atsumiense]